MSENELHTDKELLLRIAAGEENAFRSLYLAYADQVYSVALIYTKDVAQAEDVVQNVFLKLWEQREALPAIEKIDSWLFILARNLVLGHLRKNTVHENYIKHLKEKMDPHAESPEYDLLRKEQWRLLQDAVKLLSPQQRTAFLLQREEGLSYAEIADRMGIAANTVKVHLYKAMELLKTHLKQQGGAGAVILFLLFAE